MTTLLDQKTEEPNAAYREALQDAYEAYCEANGYTWAQFQSSRDDLSRYYLAGKMSGVPSFNFPKFDAAAQDLRRRGIIVLSPAEMDDEESHAMAMASLDGRNEGGGKYPRAHFLKRDFLIVVEADGIVVLDDWKESRGALSETTIAFSLDKLVFAYPDLEPVSWDEHPYSEYARRRNGASIG